MTQAKNLVGLVVDKLTVISLIERSRTGTKWQCLCECGNITVKDGTQLAPSVLKKGYRVSCGCTRKSNATAARWTGSTHIPGTVLKRLIANANRRNIQIDVTPDELDELYLAQDRKCALTGVDIVFGALPDVTASLDRIDSSLGYVQGNVQWVHKDINNMKWDFSVAELIHLCESVVTPLTGDNRCDSVVVTHHSKSWRGVGNIPLDFYTRYRKGAARRNLEFDVTLDQLWELFIKQAGYCAVTGLPIWIGSSIIDVTASIDRVDNLSGYTIDNVQWVHKDFNSKLRKDMSMGTVINWCKLVVEHANENRKN